jgi:hypothetical protein
VNTVLARQLADRLLFPQQLLDDLRLQGGRVVLATTARWVRADTLGINGYATEVAASLGGYPRSGIGREFGPEALTAYRHRTSIFRPNDKGGPTAARVCYSQVFSPATTCLDDEAALLDGAPASAASAPRPSSLKSAWT